MEASQGFFLSSHKFRRINNNRSIPTEFMKENVQQNSSNKKLITEAFERLLTIMDELRAGCPWDKAQTFESLRHLTIEEVYELSDAILEKDMDGIKKELGDLMLHLVFYAKIGSETNDFNMKDVLDDIAEKLIHRHPHIYGDIEVTDADEVKNNWEKLKLQEGKKISIGGRSTINATPSKSLPDTGKSERCWF